MEGLLSEVRCQIIADFYGKNVSKGKMYTFQHFKKMGCKKKRHTSCNEVSWCRRGRGAGGGAGKAALTDKSPGIDGDIFRSWPERGLTWPFTNLHYWPHKENAVYISESFFALCWWNLPMLMFYIVWIDHTHIHQPLKSAFSSQFA